ncbi:hypothetical protein E3N88_23362 [Mikania micrantha]|uniref:Tf2-1-like SH3-like domain-containing protein n=1 Tax=Mikania micrantha TaxID=192012 RepID=A0A5N6ND32_9ASTR|nr:hypothetical protein E3N88_23362 [Mikania micrantha]
MAPTKRGRPLKKKGPTDNTDEAILMTPADIEKLVEERIAAAIPCILAQANSGNNNNHNTNNSNTNGTDPETNNTRRGCTYKHFMSCKPKDFYGNDGAIGDRQKSYADNRRKPLEFAIGDKVMLKVSPWKGVVRFGKKGKLAPRYVGPFEILDRIGPVAYKLQLPQELGGVHDTFHVSNLKKCLSDETLIIPLDEVRLDDKLHFIEEPIEVMDRDVKTLKRSRIPIVKVRWNSKRGPEFTWEREDHMKKKYPQLFTNDSTLVNKD